MSKFGELDVRNFVMSHIPFASLVVYKNGLCLKQVLKVCGGEGCIRYEVKTNYFVMVESDVAVHLKIIIKKIEMEHRESHNAFPIGLMHVHCSAFLLD